MLVAFTEEQTVVAAAIKASNTITAEAAYLAPEPEEHIAAPTLAPQSGSSAEASEPILVTKMASTGHIVMVADFEADIRIHLECYVLARSQS